MSTSGRMLWSPKYWHARLTHCVLLTCCARPSRNKDKNENLIFTMSRTLNLCGLYYCFPFSLLSFDDSYCATLLCVAKNYSCDGIEKLSSKLNVTISSKRRMIGKHGKKYTDDFKRKQSSLKSAKLIPLKINFNQWIELNLAWFSWSNHEPTKWTCSLFVTLCWSKKSF